MKTARPLSLSAYLALSYLVVILVGMGLVAPLAWLAVERLYLNTQSASLLAQAELVASALQTEAPSPTGALPYSQTSNALPGIHTRVIDAQGGVVIDLSTAGQPADPGSLLMPQLAQNAAGVVTAAELLTRPEIAQARRGQSATAIRRVAVAGGQRVLYAAAPVLADNPSGAASGAPTVAQIVYLATPLPDTQWTALPTAVRWQFAGVILAAVMLSSAAGLLLARRIARPLGKLAAAAHAVAAGDLGQTVPADPAIAELAVLGQAFNSMTTGLRQADQAKTAFISDVSHELRTPLTVIKGTIETLEDGALDDLTARGPFLASMSRETDRLIRLVNDLLVLTRADAGALNLQLQPVDLLELARARCEHFARTARQRQVCLQVVTLPHPESPEPYTVLADADRLAQVLDNLLDNAIRYSPFPSDRYPEPTVTVTLTHETPPRVSIQPEFPVPPELPVPPGHQDSLGTPVPMVACRVTDTGPGIPTQHLPLIFERFYRVDSARGRGQGGSGLGLAIVRSLVLAHGGRVTASSPTGQGTTIAFWLPIAPPR